MIIDDFLSLTISKSTKKKKGLKYLNFLISSKFYYLLLTYICVTTGLLTKTVGLNIESLALSYIAVVACFFLHSYKYNLE